MNKVNEVLKEFNRPSKKEIRRAKQGRRPMTEEEKAYANKLAIKAKERYETNLKIGGIDERGNFTALSNRLDNTRRYGK